MNLRDHGIDSAHLLLNAGYLNARLASPTGSEFIRFSVELVVRFWKEGCVKRDVSQVSHCFSIIYQTILTYLEHEKSSKNGTFGGTFQAFWHGCSISR